MNLSHSTFAPMTSPLSSEDRCMPAQFWGTPKPTPIQEIAVAVIEQAVDDLDHPDEHVRQGARRWLSDPNDGRVGSLSDWCSYVGADPHYVARGVPALLARLRGGLDSV